MTDLLKNGPFAPELCKLSKQAPSGDAWLHEVKWDGYRILATVVDGKARLWSRNAVEWTAKIPELAAAIAALKVRDGQFDGEMVVLHAGVSNFNALQSRLSAENAEPAIYVLFDMPYLNGEDLRGAPLVERKKKLQSLLKRRKIPLLGYSAHQIGHGPEMFEQAQYNGLEGIVSKKVDSPYRGDRNGDWVKVKARPSDEFAVVGFTNPKGGRAGIGALLLAKRVRGEWVYIGRVGTGFTDKQLRALRKQLARDIVATPSANAELMERKDHALAIWVKPRLVVEVFHQGFGGQGLLRQPAFKTLREDKTTKDLAAEDKGRKGPRLKRI